VEFYRERPVFYSLGNFLTYKGFNLDGPLGQTTVLELELDGDGRFRSARMPSLVQIPQTGPAPDSTNAAVRLLRRVTRLDFRATGARIDEDGTVLPP
jgi:poly-gamma-glutamate capsule biosynthesis protein CapA/YwtB (metallophosphatase superfamily)